MRAACHETLPNKGLVILMSPKGYQDKKKQRTEQIKPDIDNRSEGGREGELCI